MTNKAAVLPAINAFLSGFVLAGGAELALVRGSYVTRDWMFDCHRECKDLDLLYLLPYSLEKIEKMVRDSIACIPSDLDVLFKTETLEFCEIWEQSLSPGVRVEILYSVGNDVNSLQIDIAANDPMVDEPIEKKVNFGNGEYALLKAPSLETSIAWKFHGLFEHLSGAWMSKTLWDLYVLCRHNTIDIQKLDAAIQLAFDSRLDPIYITKRFFFGDFAQSKKSRKNWQKEILNLGVNTVPNLSEVLHWLKNFLLEGLAIQDDGSLLTNSEVITYRVRELRKLDTPSARTKLKTLNRKTKVLATKAYNSIPHLPNSRLGPSERTIDKNKVRMLTEQSVNKTDVVVVQEKLDGSCVCAYRRNDEIFALGRDGDLASESPNLSRRLWSDWVEENQQRFLNVLKDGERLCGEWLAMAHGTRYKLPHEPFVVFDLFDSQNQAIGFEELQRRCGAAKFITPMIVHSGDPCSIPDALSSLNSNHHGAIDEPEGLIFRLERLGRVLFRAKYVRSNKVDGCYLPELTGKEEVWNWFPADLDK